MMLRYDKTIEDKFVKCDVIDAIFSKEIESLNDLKIVDSTFL